MDERRRREATVVERDEGAVLLLLGARFRFRNVVSPVLMSTIATAPAVGGFFATVQSCANAGTVSMSADALASSSLPASFSSRCSPSSVVYGRWAT
jgi:hypothetical protein